MDRDKLATIQICPATCRSFRGPLCEFCVFALRILGEIRAQIEVETQMVLKSRLLGNSAFEIGLIVDLRAGNGR